MNAGDIRVSDADRDQVSELLHAAYAEGRITADEHQERIEAVLRAKTFHELTALTADLVPASMTHTTELDPVSHPDRITAVLSTTRREGPWRVRRRSVASNFMGSIKLDLTAATFDAQTVEINGTQFMSSMTLRVPMGTTVRDETTRAMSSTSIRGLGEPDPRMPTIVLTGTMIMSDIKVRGPKEPSRWLRALGTGRLARRT